PFKLWCFTTTSVTDAQAFSKGTSSPAVAVSIAYRGGSGVVAFAGQANASTTSHALAPVTTTTPDSVVLGVLSEGTTSSAIGHTIPDGWNGEERIDYASDSGIGRVGMIAVYDTVLTSPGTQGGTITSSTSGHSATVTLALSGVGGGSGGDPTPPTGDVVDTDDELNWVAPSVPGDYVIRYEVTS